MLSDEKQDIQSSPIIDRKSNKGMYETDSTDINTP
jgi:hypothetical protein